MAPPRGPFKGVSTRMMTVLHGRALNLTDPVTIDDYLAVQWITPGDILSVLLILGPDIIQKAVGQLAGRTVVPIAFSFGWVAYAVGALVSAFGDGRLMPDTDMENTTIIGATSGHLRTTKSWVLGRLLRDFDEWVNKQIENEAAHVPPDREGKLRTVPAPPGDRPQRTWEALRVSVFDVDEHPPCEHGVPALDWVWLLGFVVIGVQLVISIIPWIVDKDWSAFLVTASGNLLALVGGLAPQWREEKWACPKKGGATITLTQGNGSRHAVVIKGKHGAGLDLEILARSTRTSKVSLTTRIVTAILAFLWIIFLITVSGIKKHTWYLLGIGLLGSIQNVMVVGVPRKPSALGVHLKLIETIRGTRVADVLKEVEQKHQFVGTSLVSVFFPGGLRVKDDDLSFWREAMDERLRPNRYGTRIDLLPPAMPHASSDLRSVEEQMK